MLNALVCPFKRGERAVFIITKIDINRAIKWLQENNGEFISAIGSEIAAERFTKWSGVYIPISKEPVQMEPGDEALAISMKKGRKYYQKKDRNEIKPSDFDLYIIYRES